MEMSEVSCTNCGKHVVIGNEYMREQVFCTLGCMDQFEEKANNISNLYINNKDK